MVWGWQSCLTFSGPFSISYDCILFNNASKTECCFLRNFYTLFSHTCKSNRLERYSCNIYMALCTSPTSAECPWASHLSCKWKFLRKIKRLWKECLDQHVFIIIRGKPPPWVCPNECDSKTTHFKNHKSGWLLFFVFLFFLWIAGIDVTNRDPTLLSSVTDTRELGHDLMTFLV